LSFILLVLFSCQLLTGLPFLYTVGGVSADKTSNASVPGLVIERAGEVLTFTLDHADHGNQFTGAMFDAVLATLQEEASRPSARVLRIRARGKVFCTGRERAARDVE
jgi:hypothetical protein